MTKKISINPDQPTVGDVWQYYENMRDSVVQTYSQAKYCRLHNPSACDPRFLTMGIEAIDDALEQNFEGTDQQACLFLIAPAEASFRVDFLQRVYDKRKDEISRQFRSIYNGKRNYSRLNIILEDDILDIWTERVPASKSPVGDFKGALNYRHWLAHGRYWVPKLGRRCDPAGILSIILAVFDSIGIQED